MHSAAQPQPERGPEQVQVTLQHVREHILEIVSDSGEGAQKAGQSFGAIAARTGRGVWTVEIIPAEIKPPARSRAGASGIRIRLGDHEITNMGDEADLVVAFNEQVLYGRIGQKAYRPGTILLLDDKWKTDPREEVRAEYDEAVERFRERMGLDVRELAIETECARHTPNPKVGKNMFVLGMLSWIYNIDPQRAREQVRFIFGKKDARVIELNQQLVDAGYAFAARSLNFRFEVGTWDNKEPLVVMNGNEATGLGVMASGMELVSMYPITPATSVSHYLASAFPNCGGFVHQAEDEIAAIGVAIGASYAGKTACTVTSGPGLALKTEFLGLAVMAEVPLVVVLVQRGGPSTGLPTKVEQGDLLATLYGEPGDAPKVILAASNHEECFNMVITARRMAEAFRTPVIVLTDANLATGVAPFRRPKLSEDWLAPPLDQSPWDRALPPFAWDPETGLSPRPIPGQKGGQYTLTGLAHTEHSKVAYDPEVNQRACEARSRKLRTLRRALRPPEVHGDPEGDLLVVGWGSTWGAITEAVDRARAEGLRVSSLHLRVLSPLEPGLEEIFPRFRQVMTVEINYSDPPGYDPRERRLSQLAWLLRATTLTPVDCWSNVYGQPIRPRQIYAEIVRRLTEKVEN